MSVVPILVELAHDYGGVWEDITSYVDMGDGSNITITRGRQNEGSTVEATRITLRLNNKDGRFSPRNPRSPLYNLIGRNTPLRVTVDGSVRAIGEVTEWPQQWNDTGADVWTTIVASGIIRRLGQGESPTVVAYRGYIESTTPAGYYPLDDQPGSTFGLFEADQFAAIRRFKFQPNGTGNVFAFGTGDLGPNLPKGLSVTKTGTAAPAAGYTASSYLVGGIAAGSDVCIDLVFKANTLAPLQIRNRDYSSNQAQWDCYLRADGVNNDVRLIVHQLDPDLGDIQTVVATSAAQQAALTDGQLHHLRFTMKASGADTNVAALIDGVSVVSGTMTGQQINACAEVQVFYNGADDTQAVALGHIAMWRNSSEPPVANVLAVLKSYLGETAGRRIQRLCGAKGIAFTSSGDLDQTIPMGPQPDGKFLALLQECETADAGILYEPRAALGFAYRTRRDLYNQTATLALDYTAGVLGAAPAPTDDDQQTKNDVTVTSSSGQGSARDVLTDGRLSTQQPPNGVGTYDTSLSVNVVTDALLPDQASWRLALGTVDESRYPQLTINMQNPAIRNNAPLYAAAKTLDLGGLVTISNPPAWLPPDLIAELVQGYSETIALDTWQIVGNFAPASPYDVGVYTGPSGDDRWRYDAENSYISTSYGQALAADTSIRVDTALFTAIWTTDPAAFPFDIICLGERMTVTAISGTAHQFQTFTVTRGVNGINKNLPSGSKIHLFHRSRYAL